MYFFHFRPKISKTPKLLTSGLDENERQQISKFIDVFDLSHFNDYNPEITHLIINNNPSGSTLKFLEALADGKWVVNLDWVIKSLESGQILPEVKISFFFFIIYFKFNRV